MKRAWMKRRERTTSPVAWIAAVTVAVGATALAVTLMPSARRYLRLRAM
jgi:hypothetical protein